ncbi:MAG: AMP-binding protein [Candidatus Aminicenantes bacterium]
MTFNKEQFVYELFEEQAQKKPDAIAIEFGRTRMTYRELDQLSGEIALNLMETDFNAGDVVALEYHSPVEMIPGIVGILKAGGAYLPFNSGTAGEYIQQLLRRSKVNYYLKTGTSGNNVDFQGKTLVYDQWECGNGNARKREIQNHRKNPFTVIYESNSSGKPEGISLSHEKIINWLQFNLEKLRIDFTRTLFISSSRMEISFPTWIGNLATGGSVYFYDPKGNGHFPNLLKLTAENNFTSVVCPLSFLEKVASPDRYKDFFNGSIKNILSVGENTFNFNINKFKEYIKNRKTPIRWHNYYGFPEINMITTLVEDEFTNKETFIHMGRPASETRAYVLNKTMQLASIGKIGHLYLAGNGVMDSYYRNDRLNRTHFVKNDGLPDPIIYKTGFKAYWLPDGKLSLLGRTDNLVNINGTRVAPEEVEAALFRHPQVKDCAVTAKNVNRNSSQLTAYLVLKEDLPLNSLEEFLKNILPQEYFPIGYVKTNSLPRTPDGAVDRKYLDQLEPLDSLRVQALEKRICEFPQIQQAAVLVKEKTEPPVPLYIKDYVSDLPPVSLKKKEESRMPELPVPGPESLQRSQSAIIHGPRLVWEEEDPTTLPQALKWAAKQHGQKGIRFIRTDGSTHFLDYSSLLAEAEKVLAGLKKAGLKPQDKVIFQFNRNEDFLSAFWGCMLGGIVPVPLMVPKSYAKTSNETETLRRIWELLDHPVVLSNQHLESSICSLFKDFRVEKIENLRDNEADSSWHESSPEDTAMILFTSGSTGIPKGVVQCHRSIISREKSTTMHNGGGPDEVSINWMPLEHVGGVVMFHLNDVYMGCQQIQVSTEYILADPLRWLDIIHQYRGTITWAPNFAYALVSEGVEKKPDRSWDLSSMRFMLNGGEAVNAVSSRKFLKLLAPFGLAADAMKPAWGMSETCSGVTYSHRFTTDSDQGIHYLDKQALASGLVKKAASASGPNTAAFVELGTTIPGTSIRIVDSGNQVVKEGVVGRLQIQGPTVTSGYYQNPELNKEVFTPDGWFDTGDLAFILEGRMTICGRAKDVIILNGINLNSMEIEAAVEEVEGVELSYTAACAVREENSDTDRVVIFYHSTYTDFNQVLNQVKQIQKKFAEKFGLNLDYVIPVAKEDIPKTSIGKIQRLKLARSFQQGAFQHIVKKVDIGLENENTLPPWFFTKTWRQHSTTVFDDADIRDSSTCLVFEDEAGLSTALAEGLEKENCRCIKVKPGNKFQFLGAGGYQIDYREISHYRRLIMEIEKSDLQIDDIFHVYGCRVLPVEPGEINAAQIKDEHDGGLYSILYLLQALETRHHRAKRLFVVTDGGHVISAQDRADYRQCSVSGFLKSVSLELDWLHCCHIDLDSHPDLAADSLSAYLAARAENLVKEWKNAAVSREVAYRKGQRLEPLLSRVDVETEEKQALPIKRGGIYLVTGGLGGIGTHVCRWLLEKCAAKLIIIGRTPLPEKKEWNRLLKENQQNIAYKRIRSYLDLEAAAGRGELIYAAGDAADLTFLTQLKHQAESQWQDTLAGVFHIAGALTDNDNLEHHWQVMDTHRVVRETRQTFEEAFQSKVYGTLSLHQLLKDCKETIFVGFSSTTAFFGSPTLSAYSSANGFLDGFCQYRQAAGWPNTYCLNWSSWENVGMGENSPEPMVNAMLTRGYDSMLPHQGVSSLEIALRLPSRQLFIGLNGSNAHIRGFMGEFPSAKQEVNVFYTTKNRDRNDVSKWRDSIIEMLPTAVRNNRTQVKLHPVEEIPFIDGKFIDYRQLEKLGSRFGDTTTDDKQSLTETEKKLVKIWREILGKTHIDINDNFFELGGNSLNATVLAAEIHKALNIEISLQEIFTSPTINEMAAYLTGAVRKNYISIHKAEEQTYYALTTSQKRMYINQQASPHSIFYNVTEVVIMEEEVKREKLTKIFQELIKRHESLRTSFVMIEGEPVQQVLHEVEFEIEYHDLKQNGKTWNSTAREAQALIIEDFRQPFDLSKAPLLRVGLVKLREERYMLMVDIHHLISDEVSRDILIKNFTALTRGEKLPPLKLQYKDYSQWLNNREQSSEIKQQKEYWLKQFEKEVSPWELPTDFERSEKMNLQAAHIHFNIDPHQTQLLKKILIEEDVTVFMLTFALYNIFLSKISRKEDIVVGTPTSGRRHADLNEIIGFFVNTLPIRNYPQKNKTFREFLREVKDRTLEAFENQEYQFRELMEGVSRKSLKNRNNNPLFNTVFSFITLTGYQGEPTTEKNETKWSSYGFEVKGLTAEFLFQAIGPVENLSFTVRYSTELFKKETIERFVKYYKEILVTVVEKRDTRLGDIHISHHLFDQKIKIPETSFNF